MMIFPAARRRLECSSWASSRRVDGTLAAMGMMHVPPLCPGSGAGSTAMHPPVVVRARGRFGDAVGQLRLFAITARHAAMAWLRTVPSVGRHAQAKGGDDILVVSLTVMAKSETEVSLFATTTTTLSSPRARCALPLLVAPLSDRRPRASPRIRGYAAARC